MRYIALLCMVIFIGCGTESTPSYQLTTTVQPAEAGSISPASGEFDEGTEILLSANANEHWVFSGWQGGGLSGTDNPFTLVMNSDTDVTALFTKKEYPLTILTVGNGTITERVVQPKTTNHKHGTMVELTAEPNEDFWTFKGWNGDLESTENPVTIEVVNALQIQGVFEINTYTINSSVSGNGSITISSDKTEFEHGEELTVKAVEEPGWKFTGWSGDVSTNENPLVFTIEKDTDLIANFEEATYSLSINKTGNGSVSYSPNKETYTHGDVVNIEAKPLGDNLFIHWEGDLESTNQQETFAITQDTEITAVFRSVEESLQQQYVSMSSLNHLVLSAGIQLQNNLGDDVTLTRFTVFTESGGQVARNNEEHVVKPGSSIGFTLSFNIPQPRTAVSKFQAEWRVTYKGKSYIKKAPFGELGSVNKQVTYSDFKEIEADI